MKFTNLTIESPIVKNLGFGKTTVPQNSYIEKGFSYNSKVNFVKTGKDIIAKLESRNSLLSAKVNLLETENERLKNEIGTEPDSKDYDYWCTSDDYGSYDEDNRKYFPCYKVTYDERVSMKGEVALTSNTEQAEDVQKIKASTDLVSLKNRYNENQRKITRINHNIEDNELYKRNISSKKSYQLDPRELKELNF